ncbi:peptidylprolyl isomerase [Sphingomonas flavalba]|uniref:peptidylprolyl isomerase n=1 Tax=Sphingomonas flavalba TaxID=2559804 RepID=UPI0039E1F0A0
MRFLIGLLAILGLATAAGAQSDTPTPTASPTPAPESSAPPVDPQNIWVLDLSNGGRVRMLLRPDKAPNHVERIKVLTRRGFYNGLTFHRVIDGFMAQGGDPEGTGAGGSDLPDVKAEFNDMPHVRGAVSAARAQDPDSANSQFYIVLMPRLQLDGKYTVFGRVISGMDAVDRIEKGEPPMNPTRILRAWVEADGEPPAVAAPTLNTDVPAAPPTIAKPTGKR